MFREGKQGEREVAKKSKSLVGPSVNTGNTIDNQKVCGYVLCIFHDIGVKFE
jgi:hypothetical protein